MHGATGDGVMGVPGLALRSLRQRLFAAVLTVITIALSVWLLLGVERLRQDARRATPKGVEARVFVMQAV